MPTPGDFRFIISYNIGMKTYHYIVKGMVQGVAFRYYTIKYAHSFLIRGTVKNLYSGDVEVYAQGDEEDIRRFEAFLQSGPPAAQVTRLVKEELELEEVFPEFEIIY